MKTNERRHYMTLLWQCAAHRRCKDLYFYEYVMGTVLQLERELGMDIIRPELQPEPPSFSVRDLFAGDPEFDPVTPFPAAGVTQGRLNQQLESARAVRGALDKVIRGLDKNIEALQQEAKG